MVVWNAFNPEQPRQADGKFGSGGGTATLGRGAKKRAARRSKREFSQAGVVGKAAAVGKAIGRVEHAIAHKVEESVNKLPRWAQKIVKGVYNTFMASYTAGQALAEKVARERGATPEQAAKLRGVLAAADVAAAKPAAIFGGLAGSMIPAASACYLLYSTVRNPLATIRAAGKLVKEAVSRRKLEEGQAKTHNGWTEVVNVFDPDQPRDSKGRFGSDGGGSMTEAREHRPLLVGGSEDPHLPHWQGWHLVGRYYSDVGSFLLHHGKEAALLEVPEGIKVDDVRSSLKHLGASLKYVTASHDHWDHIDQAAWKRLQKAFPGAQMLHPAELHGDKKLSLAGEPLHLLKAPKHSKADLVAVFKGVAMTGDLELGTLHSHGGEVGEEDKIKSMRSLKEFQDRTGYKVYSIVSAHLDDVRTGVDWPSLFRHEKDR